jgi:exonuclease SbcD
MARLRDRFPHIAELRHEPPELARAGGAERHRQVRQARSPLQLATAFFTDQHGQPPGEPEAELLRAALAAAERGGER